MPYKSEAQRRKFKAMEEAGEVTSVTVAEFDKATGDKKLPEKVSRKAKTPRAAAVVKGRRTKGPRY